MANLLIHSHRPGQRVSLLQDINIHRTEHTERCGFTSIQVGFRPTVSVFELSMPVF